jgi:hypothetical protein
MISRHRKKGPDIELANNNYRSTKTWQMISRLRKRAQKVQTMTFKITIRGQQDLADD